MTRIISFANHKGGVGKTTSTAAVGSCLAEAGYKTLLIDLDGQQNLTSHYLGEDDERLSVFDSLVKGVALPVVPVKENLWLVPSSLEMAGAEISMVNRLLVNRCCALCWNLSRVSMTTFFLIVLLRSASSPLMPSLLRRIFLFP